MIVEYTFLLLCKITVFIYSCVLCFVECELKTPHYFSSQAGEDYFVLKSYFSKPLKCGGTFVEMGAYNGITLSVSLFFEKYLNWRGLLVEANPDNYKLVLQNRPNTTAFGLAAGYCPEGHIKFNGGGGGGNIIDEEMNPLLKADGKRVIEVPCVPLGGLLRRAGLQSIDLFILDVEGAEYSALTTMDWSIPVKVWVVEVNHSDRQQIIDIFAEHGYYKDSIDITQMCRDHHAFLDKDPAFISERGIQCTPSYIFRKK